MTSARSAARKLYSIVVMMIGILAFAGAANAKPLQCAPYARQISGIEIYGNASSWWEQAAGRYLRGHAPRVGSVLAFAPTARMRYGHVAMVSQVISDREIRLTHANWSYRGGIEHDVVAIDVSEAGDWSEVKVWYAPQGGLGITAYPTQGFIYADAPAPLAAPRVALTVPSLDDVMARLAASGATVGTR